MTMILCRDCKQQVSNKAKQCPHCGALDPQKVSADWKLISILTAAVIFVVILISPSNETNKTSSPKTPEQVRKERILEPFDPYTGEHYRLIRYVKKVMNDPDSFEHVKTTYSDMKDYIVVHMTFRGKNAFGGKVINEVSAKTDLDGNVIGIVSQSP